MVIAESNQWYSATNELGNIQIKHDRMKGGKKKKDTRYIRSG